MALNLGTETGSLMNHLYSRMTIGAPAPVVGMGATLLAWTDRHAATVIEVCADGKIRVQEDTAKVVKGSTYDGSAEYEYSANPAGHVTTFRPTKSGGWEAVHFSAETKRWKKTGGNGLRIGSRDEHRDPSF